MALIYDLVKDRKIYSVEADRTVLEAARFMMEHKIGALPVLRDGQLVGIFSERDIMNRVVAVGRPPGTTSVSEVMSSDLIVAATGKRAQLLGSLRAAGRLAEKTIAERQRLVRTDDKFARLPRRYRKRFLTRQK